MPPLISTQTNTLSLAVSTLAEGQKALEQYAASAKPEQFLSSTPLSPNEKQKLIEQYVHSPQGKQELEKQLRKEEKAHRQPIIWQIPEEKMNELKWQRTQLLRMQQQQKAKANPQAAKQPVKKVTQGPVKKVDPTRKPPKLGSSKASSKASSVAGQQEPKPLGAANQAKKNLPNGAPVKAPTNNKPPTVAKAAPKPNGVAK
ncbi:MAG: hypothetical protein Q9201_000677 [Fulgogasparrea decipioides]